MQNQNLKNNSHPDNEKKGRFMGNAFKLSTELVSAVIVGTIIGFILDSWFGTKPWLIIVFFFLGSAAGMLNVIKVAKRMQKKISLRIFLWQQILCISSMF